MVTNVSRTTRAVIETVLNASAWHVPNGSADRQAELLDVPYFHVVFTVPAEIEVIAFQNQTVVYDILFRAASETLRTIAADPEHLGAEIGFLGGSCTRGDKTYYITRIFIFSFLAEASHPMEKAGSPADQGSSFRSGCCRGCSGADSLHDLEQAFRAGELNFFSAHRHLHEPAAFLRYLAPVWNTEWVVYAKRPFAGPAQVLEDVGRYTHRVAISNNRLVSMDNGRVRFRWKDYRERQLPEDHDPGCQ